MRSMSELRWCTFLSFWQRNKWHQRLTMLSYKPWMHPKSLNYFKLIKYCFPFETYRHCCPSPPVDDDGVIFDTRRDTKSRRCAQIFAGTSHTWVCRIAFASTRQERKSCIHSMENGIGFDVNSPTANMQRSICEQWQVRAGVCGRQQRGCH